MDKITTSYSDIEITYDEKRDLWCFELRGRARTADSLEKAKAAIDAPVKEKKPFERVKAWIKSGGYNSDPFVIGEITSIGETARYGGGDQVWTLCAGARSLKSARCVYPSGGHNDKIISEWLQLNKENSAIEEKMSALMSKLQPYVVPNES